MRSKYQVIKKITSEIMLSLEYIVKHCTKHQTLNRLTAKTLNRVRKDCIRLTSDPSYCQTRAIDS